MSIAYLVKETSKLKKKLFEIENAVEDSQSQLQTKIDANGDVMIRGNIIANEGIDGTNARGIMLWNATDNDWAIYMGQSGAGKSFSGGSACTGVLAGVNGQNLSGHAIRIRTGTYATQGLIYENSSEQCLFSVSGTATGTAFFSGYMAIGVLNHAYTHRLSVAGNIAATVGSLYAPNGYCYALGYPGPSDRRIKSYIQDLDDGECTAIINRLQPKKYKYKRIDLQLNRQKEYTYGFISQEVNEVLPDLITYTTQVIPNIQRSITIDSSNICTILNTSNISLYDVSSNIQDFTYDYSPNVNDVIEVVDKIENKSSYVIVENILSSNQFEISYKEGSTPIDSSNLFANGTRVDDFCSLDKMGIYTICVGAIQELSAKLNTALDRITYLESVITSNI